MSPPQANRPLQQFVAALGNATEMVASASKLLMAGLAPAMAAFAEGLSSLPDELRPTVLRLVERGWFISAEMDIPTLRHFETLIESAALDQLDGAMSYWIERHLDRILCDASLRFPQRAKILQAAFSAHRAGAYELSVPVLIAQTEGMCIEVLGKKLFATKDGVPRTKEAADALGAGALTQLLCLPLREAHGLSASEATRGQWPHSPNRHEILHGISTDYPTQLNSLKVLSLLEYFVGLVAPIKARQSADNAAA